MIARLLPLFVTVAGCGKGSSDATLGAPAGSGSASAGSAAPPEAAAPGPGWSTEQAGLRVKLELPATVTLAPPPNGSQPVVASVTVHNTSARPIRIIRIRPELFRLFTSSLRVWQAGKVVSLQPEGRPHGYLITEEDFLVIPAGDTTTHPQTLYLIDALARPGTFEVELMFENKSKRFPGGVNTLDGVTKPLFGGTDVPDLWTGTLSARTTFTVQ